MTQVALTGDGGFLQWHTRCSALASGLDTTATSFGEDFTESRALSAIAGASRLVHIAGVDQTAGEAERGPATLLAALVGSALEHSENPPPLVVFARSVNADGHSVLGATADDAAAILSAAADRSGAGFVDVPLPNVFGEHGTPTSDSMVSALCHQLATGGDPKFKVDREITLLHAQDAADVLLGNTATPDPFETRTTTFEVLTLLSETADAINAGDMPMTTSEFSRNLFHTYASLAYELAPTSALERHSDARGSLVELVRTHGGASQTSFSSTAPGESRARHFHRRRIERIVPLSGTAVISLRKLFTDRITEIVVDAAKPVAVHIPTMWVHDIVNRGREDFLLAYWTDRHFDSSSVDAFPAEV